MSERIKFGPSYIMLNQRTGCTTNGTCMLQSRISWTKKSSITKKVKQFLQ